MYSNKTVTVKQSFHLACGANQILYAFQQTFIAVGFSVGLFYIMVLILVYVFVCVRVRACVYGWVDVVCEH